MTVHWLTEHHNPESHYPSTQLAWIEDGIATYDASTALVTVTSQVALRPSLHRIDVCPPGRFPSDVVPDGWNASPG